MSVQSQVLYFREAPHLPALIFATPERAEFIDRLHRAIGESKTWGEFRSRLPLGEYQSLYADVYTSDPEVVERDADAREPRNDEQFSCDYVPGFSDGDYPPWLATEQHRFLPEDVLKAFGTRETSPINGLFWSINAEKLEEVLGALRARGYEVVERQDLKFW
jgi:hypothetical protein